MDLEVTQKEERNKEMESKKAIVGLDSYQQAYASSLIFNRQDPICIARRPSAKP